MENVNIKEYVNFNKIEEFDNFIEIIRKMNCNITIKYKDLILIDNNNINDLNNNYDFFMLYRLTSNKDLDSFTLCFDNIQDKNNFINIMKNH